MIIAEIIRVLGPTVIRSFLGGGNTSGGNNGATGVSPFEEDEDEGQSGSTGSDDSRVSISLPSFDEEATDAPNNPSITTSATTTESSGDVTTLITTSTALDRIRAISSETKNEVITTL